MTSRTGCQAAASCAGIGRAAADATFCIAMREATLFGDAALITCNESKAILSQTTNASAKLPPWT
jgi:hypothetical protein